MLATLGPILTSTLGTKSAEACRLYERAVRIARRRPAGEQAEWFPVYWGWWYTGSDFGVQRARAAEIMSDLGDVDDPDVRLQVYHCVWAIDFNTGHHDSCVAAVDDGLRLYRPETAREGLALYSGHDAKVCGLGQKGLSLWLKGFPSQAVNLINESVNWALELEHVGSLAHAYDIAAMLHCYRRDHDSLRRIVDAMRELADGHALPLLRAKADIFDGWTMALLGNPDDGRKTVENGLAIQEDIGTREDFPVYAEMLSQILKMSFDLPSARDLLGKAIEEAERTGHLYWLPELYRRRALIVAEIGDSRKEVVALLKSSLRLALDQNALTLFLRAFTSALELKVSGVSAEDFKSGVATAINTVESGGELASIVNMIKASMPTVMAAGR
jgi:predicted ATPase